MKKVRYLLGAVGAAPALGLLIPAANAAAPAAQTTHGNAGKTVSVDQGRTPRANCAANETNTGQSADGWVTGLLYYSGNICVYLQAAFLHKRQTGLTERTRYYSGGGKLERTTWQAGLLSGTSTIFSSKPDMYAHEVCMALVANNNHNDVKYGPECLKT